MAKIDLNNFNVVKFGNIDIERNYINDILHAIVGKLNDLQAQINSISGGGSSGGADVNATYITAEPEINLPNSAQLTGESSVITVTNNASTVEVGVAVGGISTPKIEDGAVTIPKIGATGTPDNTTFLRGDGTWNVADLNFVYTQAPASATWIIVHNLGKYPSVTIEDSGGNDIEGEITYDSTNQVTLTFSAAFTGTAYLN